MPLGKRIFDLLFVLAAAPLFVAVACLIFIITRLKSPGPILFWQDRVGKDGKLFRCCKFRTMHVGISIQPHIDLIKSHFESGRPMAKLENKADPRMIPCGTIIRAAGLDELPQIINILRGEMSLIGPRPWTTYEHELLSAESRQRMSVHPGLTGLWQVSGKNHTTVPEMLALDLHYARHRTFSLDLVIIVKTPLALLTQMIESRKIPACRALAPKLRECFGLTPQRGLSSATPQ